MNSLLTLFRVSLALFLFHLVLSQTGCNDSPSEQSLEQCTPLCDQTRCTDGCGGICACAPDAVCNANLDCVTPEDCTDTCDLVGWQCGEVCGNSCGVCLNNETCLNGYCDCEPVQCDGLRCGADGCGGTCECAQGTICNAQNYCVNDDACTDTCATANWQCGELCGVTCGVCGPNEHCEQGSCICQPQCDGTSCGSDGCGGVCECAEGTSCNGEEQCVDDDACLDSCEDLGWVCGEVCNVSCGECSQGYVCEQGQCHCQPQCDGSHCGSDGCGGVCDCPTDLICTPDAACVEPEECTEDCTSQSWTCGEVCGQSCGICPPDQNCIEGQSCQAVVSCDTCALTLSLVNKTAINGNLTGITLAIDYMPSDIEPRPRLFDLRLRSSLSSQLVEVVPGPALTSVDKKLAENAQTGNLWTVSPDGGYRFVAVSLNSTVTMGHGRVMTLEFSVNTSNPQQFYIERHEQTFAPGDADLALQASDYDQPIQVLKW